MTSTTEPPPANPGETPSRRSRVWLWLLLGLLFLGLPLGWLIWDAVFAPRPDPQPRELLEASLYVVTKGDPKKIDLQKRIQPEKRSSFRVAAIQYRSGFGRLDANRKCLSDLIRRAAERDAQIMVTPECAVPGYMSPDLQTAWRDPVRRPNPKDGRSLVEADAAETVPGESTGIFGALARELEVRIVVGLIEKAEVSEGGRKRVDYYNAAVLLGPDGTIECHYRKLNLWAPGDATWAQEGNLGLGIRDTEFGKLGVMICYDQSCGTAERLKAAGVTTILYPIAWVHDRPAEDWFENRLPERVKEWGLNVVGANWCLDEVPRDPNGPYGFGSSRIIAKDGSILARAAPAGDQIIYADLPLP
jgi:predicted amidohydrolase